MSLIYSSLHLEMPVLVSTLALPAHSFPPPPPPDLFLLCYSGSWSLAFHCVLTFSLDSCSYFIMIFFQYMFSAF